MTPPKRRGGKLMIKSKPHQCLFCSKFYVDKHILESHTNLHTGENPYECQNCDAAFPYITNLNRHRDLVHLKKRYKCDRCNVSYVSNQDLRSHMDRIHYGKKYICEGCRTQYSSHTTLKRHQNGGFCTGVKKVLHSIKMRKLQEKRNKITKKVLEKEIKPEINRKVEKSVKNTGSSGRINKTTPNGCASNSSRSKKAIATKNTKMQIKTEIVEKSITKNAKKPLTILTKQVNCEPIKRSQVSRKPVVTTRNIKMQTKLPDVSKRGTTLKKINGLKSSKKTSSKPVVNKTVNKKALFKCSMCQNSYSDRNQFLRHGADLHDRQIFECPVCNNLYTEYCNMIRHMKTSHPNFTDYSFGQKRDTQCALCNLTFESYSLLLQHKKEEHNLKLFKCTHCSNEYTFYANMARHRKTHEKDGTEVPRISSKIAEKCPAKNKKGVKMLKTSIPSSLDETYPTIGVDLENTALRDKTDTNSIHNKVLELVTKLKKEKNKYDESFFLHLNRYDPSST